jgi:hypothetical protein
MKDDQSFRGKKGLAAAKNSRSIAVITGRLVSDAGWRVRAEAQRFPAL